MRWSGPRCAQLAEGQGVLGLWLARALPRTVSLPSQGHGTRLET
jgi:hypothetical protein